MPSKQSFRRAEAKKNANKNTLSFRVLIVREDSLNIETRSINAVISTENPVPMMDWERWEVIPEVLRSDGAIFPEQIPLLDSHNRQSVGDQLGSAGDIRQEGLNIVGNLRFSSTAEAAFNLVKERHVTDVSAGYQVLERTFVPKGSKQKIGGREYTGPVNVVTKWKLREVSLTPIGADEQAKLRGFDPSAFPVEKDFTMNEQLRSLLESRGMPKGLSDDDAQRWAVENFAADGKKSEITISEEMRKLIEKSTVDAATKAAEIALENQQKRAVELNAICDSVCKIADVERTAELNSKLSSCRSREDIEKAVLDYKAERQAKFPLGVQITAGPQSSEKFENGMRTALIERALNHVASPEPLPGETDSAGVRSRREDAINRIFPKEQRSADAQSFRNASLFDMAREYVVRNFNIRYLDYSREQIAIMAMFGPQRAAEVLGITFRDAPAYHQTGSFANLTLDAINKSLSLGYAEAPSTWEQVMRIGTDATDFKQLNRIRMGAVPNIPIWDGHKDPQELAFSDAREHYGVDPYSASLSFGYKLLINDDMDALSRTPGQLGQAARRTLNKRAWSVITSNPTMSDGVALFAAATGARKRTNLTTGAGAPSTTTLQTLTDLMMQMRGENTPEGNESDDVLSLMPRFIVGGSALRTTIMQLVMSVYDASSNASLGYNMAAKLTPVIEPLLDASSTTAWYLFADPGQIDTVEVTFLAGHRTPNVRQELDVGTLSQKVYFLQAYGAKALNHRGAQKHAGV